VDGAPYVITQGTGIRELPAWLVGLLEVCRGTTPGSCQAEISNRTPPLPVALPPKAYGAGEADIDQMIATRMQRQQVLYDRAKRVEIILLEGALHCRLVSPGALAGQLDRLTAICGLPSLALGIIPLDAPVPVFPLSGFRLYDDLVIVESIAGEQQLADRAEIARYEKFLALLRDAARYGAEAVAVITRVSAGIGTAGSTS